LRNENQDSVVASKCGILKRKENNFLWLESQQKRYVPVRMDYVIGIVVMKSAETLKLDIGSSEYASLSFLAFENATKRNKPNVEINDVLYCRVLTGHKDMETELVCIDNVGKANGMGVLKDGYMFKVSLEFARRLLSPGNQFLHLLSKHLPPFEITIGYNGRIWLKTEIPREKKDSTAAAKTSEDDDDRDRQMIKREVALTMFIMEALAQYANVPTSNTEDLVTHLIKNCNFKNL